MKEPMKLTVCPEGEPYAIVLSRGAIQSAGEIWNLNRRVLVVTDAGVPRSYAETVAAQCGNAVIVTLPGGEDGKTLAAVETLLRRMLEADFTRQDCVIAVGGGVVGDLSGFAASVYMRGIDFYNIPTTLLAQVDSSIGGKTAVNLDSVKNPVGSFYQPKGVLIDPDVLDTLDPRELHAGLAESIKMAATSDEALFSLLETCENLRETLPEIVYRSLAIKKSVVEQDPREGGLRRVLNFGHTIGHAIEAACGGNLPHGECVALGMLPMCGGEARARLTAVLQKYALPTEIPLPPEELMPYLRHDKKRQDAAITAVFVDQIGSFRFCDMKPEDILEKIR